MTAIHVKVTGGYHSHRQHRHHFLEIMAHGLIILCTTLAIVLSTISVCDGQWLQAPGGHMFGLWDLCTSKAMALNMEAGSTAALVSEGTLNGAEDHQVQTPMSESIPAEYHVKPSIPNCTTQLGKTGVSGINAGLGLSRCLVSFAVVAAIFGLELQVMSQLSEGQDAYHRWALGSALVLVAAALSATGTAVFVTMLWMFASPLSFTLTFLGQGTAVFLFLLDGMAARHLHPMNEPKLPFGPLGKYQT